MKYTTYYIQIYSILFTILLLGCAGSSISNIPDWYEKPPVKTGYIYETGTAISEDMQLAVKQAMLAAAKKLEEQLHSEMDVLVQRAQEELGLNTDTAVLRQFSQIYQQIVAEQLSAVRVDEKTFFVAEKTKDQYGRSVEIYRAYVLIEYDEIYAIERLLYQIRKNELLYNAMKATQLYNEIERKVENYHKNLYQ